MRLPWEVLQALSDTSDTDLPHSTIARMCSLFAVTRAGFFQPHGGALRLTIGRQRPGANMAGGTLADSEVRPEERRLNEAAIAALTPQHVTFDAALFGQEPAQWTGVAVPLVLEGRGLGTLYLAGSAETLEIDLSDFPVLEGVAAQLALALDRQQLAAQQRRYEHQEQERLKAEVARLRTTLTRARFVFRSQAMNDLLNTTRRVAATDATVLVTGESGTGKEMLAHMVHDLSGRKNKSLVIVDCSAIPASLMDSELFGRERGAYTGAERRAPGRLAQADGGTVFLDEVGELPLEVQAKLLRFVQEKTLTMVGGTRAQRVDVRIIAATNRSLEEEVRAGRFREDLFHRLNVVRLRIPPLRERPDDIAFLAGHFLERFAGEYAKPLTGFDAAAQQLVNTYTWPGNVRELQNTILQAVVLAEGPVLTAADLQVRVTDASLTAVVHQRSPLAFASGTDRTPAPAAPATTAGSFDDAWQGLSSELSAAIEQVIASGSSPGFPLGKWLTRDLMLEAFEQSGRVISRAAERVGLPETTFARRLRQAEADIASTRHPDFWPPVQASLKLVVAAADMPSDRLADRIDDLMFQLVVEKVAQRVPQAASLMGVSLPTMKRRIAESRDSKVA
jgi:transcriptional regulator with GAF, ATPase, and Fis domain